MSIHVSFILLPGFALTSFSLAVEALSVANQLSGEALYEFTICSPESSPHLNHIISSNGVPVEVTASLDSAYQSDLVFIAGYQHCARYHNQALTHLLKQLNRQGRRIVSLSSASFILAKCGLLQGKSCTLVPEHLNIFAELYPQITLQENLYTVTDNICTSAGGTATLDLMLYLIGQDQGRDFIYQVSQQFMQERIRSSAEMQTTCQQVSLRIKSPCLGAAVELMKKHLDNPYPIATLAKRIGTTQRNLEMVFQKYEQTTPGRYYVQLRLQQAKQLLEESHLNLSAIAQATGFSSQSHFGKCFKERYGCSPSAIRKH